MLNFSEGKEIARTKNNVIYLNEEADDIDSDDEDFHKEIVTNSNIEPFLNFEERSVAYIAGPSGSGKTTFAIMLIKRFLLVYPKRPFYLFSRTNYKNDPAFNGMTVCPVPIDELIDTPIDIEKELTGGSIVLFDDCNTIQNDKIKKHVENLMADILEVGRKLGIWIVVTSHLVIPNERKMARTILNEMQSLTVFPKSGSSQQIRYALRQYFGLDNKQIDKILKLKSRWVMINKSYPMNVIYQHGIYIL